MSVLTKLFVVLVTVLSILLVAMVVPFVANTQNYREMLQTAQLEAEAADTSAQMAENARQRASDRASELDRQHTETSRQLESKITSLNAQLAEAQTEVRTLAAKNAQLLATVQGFGASMTQLTTISDAYKTELDKRRAEMLEQQTRSIQLADRIADIEGQLQTMTNQVRRTSEQNTQLEERARELERQLALVPEEIRVRIAGGADAEEAVTFMPDEPIRGKVVAVRQAADEIFVQVDVGANDGVSENMKFWVHRDGKFLGTLIITKADQNNSAGRMEIREGEIASGDAVLTGSGF